MLNIKKENINGQDIISFSIDNDNIFMINDNGIKMNKMIATNSNIWNITDDNLIWNKNLKDFFWTVELFKKENYPTNENYDLLYYIFSELIDKDKLFLIEWNRNQIFFK